MLTISRSHLRFLMLLLPSLLEGAPGLAVVPTTIGVEDISYLPYYETVDGKFQGLAQTILEKFAHDTKIELQFVPLPIKRLYTEFLEKKSIQLKFPDNEEWAREEKKDQKVYYSSDIIPFTDGVVVLPKNKGKGEKALKTLGTVRGFSPWVYDEEIRTNKLMISENSSINSVLQQVIAGRVDGGFINIDVAKHHLRNDLKMPEALVFDESLKHSKGQYKVSSLSNPDILQKLDEWLRDNLEFRKNLLKQWDIGG